MWTRHRKWHAANGPLPGSTTSVPTPSAGGGGWQSTGASLCGSIGTVTTGQEPVVDGFMASPHSLQIPHPCPSTNEAILSDHPQLSTVLTRCGLPRSPHGLAWHQSSIGNMHPEDVVDGNQTHATSNSTLPHAFTGKCKRSMPNTYRVGLGIIRPISENWEQICSCWFELATVRRQIWGYDQLSCGFGFRRSHLALKWKFGQGEAQFLWEQSQIHFMSFSAQWRHTKSIHIDFIASYGGVTTPFFQECIYSFMTFPA